MVNRLSLVDATLADRISAAGPEAQRAVARNVALAAAEHVGLEDERVASILAILRADVAEVPDLTRANAAVEDLDNAAFDAQDRVEDGTGSDDDYARAFAKARAATALVAAFADDPAEGAEDAIYEAYHATDEDMGPLRDTIEQVLS